MVIEYLGSSGDVGLHYAVTLQDAETKLNLKVSKSIDDLVENVSKRKKGLNENIVIKLKTGIEQLKG